VSRGCAVARQVMNPSVGVLKVERLVIAKV
jgi:hypothetical protein